MGIEMWFRDDVCKLLAAVRLAQERIIAYVPQTPESLAYCAGCDDTLDALATAFGLPSNNGIKLTRGTSRD